MERKKSKRVLILPDEHCIILSASANASKNKRNPKPGAPEAHDPHDLSPETQIFIQRNVFCDFAGTIRTYGIKVPIPTVYWYQSVATNCIILSLLPDPLAHTQRFRFMQARVGTANAALSPSIVPPISYGVAVMDFYVAHNLLIFRWPLLLYDQPIRRPDSRHRTIDRQRRESQLIEATFPPLRERPKPNPFFIPTLPLDSVWPPPNSDSVAAREG